MALVSCRDCGVEVSDRAVACPKCASPINPVQQAQFSLVLFLLGLTLLIGGIGVYFVMHNSGNAPDQKMASTAGLIPGGLGFLMMACSYRRPK
jgi:hypothetical protein